MLWGGGTGDAGEANQHHAPVLVAALIPGEGG